MWPAWPSPATTEMTSGKPSGAALFRGMVQGTAGPHSDWSYRESHGTGSACGWEMETGNAGEGSTDCIHCPIARHGTGRVARDKPRGRPPSRTRRANGVKCLDKFRGRSSVGRALASQAGCRGFESLRPLCIHARSAIHGRCGLMREMVPATKSGKDASFSIFGGWHLFRAGWVGR